MRDPYTMPGQEELEMIRRFAEVREAAGDPPLWQGTSSLRLATRKQRPRRFCLDGMISSLPVPEGDLNPRLMAPGRRAGERPRPPSPARRPHRLNADHRLSGAALNAPSQPETGDSACLQGKVDRPLRPPEGQQGTGRRLRVGFIPA